MNDIDNDVFSDLIEYIEENGVCDEHAIYWEGNGSATVDPSRSQEFKDLIKRAKEALEKE